MAIVLKEVGPAMQKRVVRLSLESCKNLNERYADIEQKYNSLISNWEWFASQPACSERQEASLVAKIDQN
ncbi:hypothetical protein [Zhaonella formicivorans]|uniref:hypothetical protein n=1 Tax=Zhaonella formicivorans TaxID=2528593 RepID=UPI0010E03108|nr:hypothetical protein [Zhaonella formicivorans]